MVSHAAHAVDELVAASRKLGGDPSLVLYGGGNTSVKGEWTDITGATVDALYVKGSGWDLATIERAGFAPLRLARLHELLALEQLSDPDMVRELSLARLDPDAPQPSVEALLHAFLPFPAVLHSHADVILMLTNTPAGERLVRDTFADAVVVPYVMPGFELARAVVGYWAEQAHDGTVGMVLMHHGLFTFGASAAEALARHDELLAGAAAAAGAAAEPAPVDVPAVDPIELAELRRSLSRAAGRPMIVARHTDAPT